MKPIKRYGFNSDVLFLIIWVVFNIGVGNLHAQDDSDLCDGPAVANLYPIAKDSPFVEQTHVMEAAAMEEHIAKHALMRTKKLETLGSITITSANGPIAFRAPRVILKSGFKVESGSSFNAGLRTFDVHFINMFPVTEPSFFTQEWCRNEVDILNHKMANQDGDPVVKFRYKSMLSWDSDFSDTDFYKCISTGWNADDPHDPYALCQDPDITPSLRGEIPGCFNVFDGRDDEAINIIIYDNPHTSYSSFANRNPGKAPFVVLHQVLVTDNLTATCNDTRHDPLLTCPCISNGTCPTPSVAPCDCNENGVFDDDPRRGDDDLLGKIVEIHEMGHAFGVHHMQPTVSSPQHAISNIMWSGSLNYDGNSKCYPGGDGRTHEWDATELFLFEPAEEFVEEDPTAPDLGERDYCQRFIHYDEACYWDDVNLEMKKDHDLLPDSSNHYGQAEIVMSYAEFIAKNIGMRTW